VWYCSSTATHVWRGISADVDPQKIAQTLEGFHDRRGLATVHQFSKNFAIHNKRSVYSKESRELQDGNTFARTQEPNIPFLGGFR
jgi:hypothetical protein